MYKNVQGSAAVNSPLWRLGSALVGAERAGRCCTSAGRAADVAPWKQRSEVAGQLETSWSCPGCLTCVGIQLETEGLQRTGRKVTLIKRRNLLNVLLRKHRALIPLRKFL